MLHCLFQGFVKLTGWLPQWLIFRTKTTFEDRSVQGRGIRGKAIVVSNHNSIWDFAVLLYAFPFRTLRCAAAEVLYAKNPFMTAMLNLLGCVRVDRGQCDFSFLERLKAVLDKGGVVEIFPESRLPDREQDTRPLPFKTSYVYLALESGAPIVPVYNNGCAFSRERLQVVIGKPIDARALYDPALSEKENVQTINRYVRRKIIELSQNVRSPFPFGENEETEETAVS